MVSYLCIEGTLGIPKTDLINLTGKKKYSSKNNFLKKCFCRYRKRNSVYEFAKTKKGRPHYLWLHVRKSSDRFGFLGELARSKYRFGFLGWAIQAFLNHLWNPSYVPNESSQKSYRYDRMNHALKKYDQFALNTY